MKSRRQQFRKNRKWFITKLWTRLIQIVCLCVCVCKSEQTNLYTMQLLRGSGGVHILSPLLLRKLKHTAAQMTDDDICSYQMSLEIFVPERIFSRTRFPRVIAFTLTVSSLPAPQVRESAVVVFTAVRRMLIDAERRMMLSVVAAVSRINSTIKCL